MKYLEYLVLINIYIRVAKEFKKNLEEARGREEEYLSNPINRLTLLRQMHEDWEPVEKLMQQPVGQGWISYINILYY